MDALAFNTLGGSFVTNGTYDPRDVKHPLFDFDLNIANLAIPAAFQTFNSVQAMMPLAQYMNGSVSTNFKIGGELTPNMMPNLKTLSGGGLLKIAEAMIKDSPVLQKLIATTKLNGLDPMQLKDLLLQAEVKDGKINYRPFDFNVKDYKFTLAGGNFLDGSLDYKLTVNAPSGALGNAANQALASFTGGKALIGDRITIPISVGGTFKAPKFVPLGASTTGSVKEAVTANVKAGVENLKAEAEARARAKADSLRAVGEAKLRAESDRVKAEAETRLKAEQEKLEARRRAVEDSARKRLQAEKKKLLNKFGFPAKKDTTQED